MSTIAETNRPTITATNLRRGDRPMETTNFAFFAHDR